VLNSYWGKRRKHFHDLERLNPEYVRTKLHSLQTIPLVTKRAFNNVTRQSSSHKVYLTGYNITTQRTENLIRNYFWFLYDIYLCVVFQFIQFFFFFFYQNLYCNSISAKSIPKRNSIIRSKCPFFFPRLIACFQRIYRRCGTVVITT